MDLVGGAIERRWPGQVAVDSVGAKEEIEAFGVLSSRFSGMRGGSAVRNRLAVSLQVVSSSLGWRSEYMRLLDYDTSRRWGRGV